jgi:hypothetical protein
MLEASQLIWLSDQEARVDDKPLKVQSVGKSVTKPAWTLGDILWLMFTGGMAWPWIWNRRQKRTTITRHQ